MRNGFIYPISNYIITKLDNINLVELFKYIARQINPDKNDSFKERAYTRFAVDLFMVLKWLFILIAWYYHWDNRFILIFVWYLIISNFYTYFYRHLWCDDVFVTLPAEKERIRRRYVALFLAFAYSNICFAYLYRIPYANHLDWSGLPSGLHAIWFSISNSLAANYSVVSALDNFGNTIGMIQLMITFIFVTVIISKSPS